LRSIHEFDVAVIEQIYIDMIPVWHMVGSSKYIKLSMQLVETMYEQLTYSQLMMLWCNKCIQLFNQWQGGTAEDCGTAMDAFIKLINKKEKKMKEAKDLEGWALQSKMRSAMWQSTSLPMTSTHQLAVKIENMRLTLPQESVTPKFLKEWQVVYELLTLVDFHVFKEGRKMSNA